MIDEILNLPEDELFAETERLRKTHFGNRIELCAIINIRSGACSMDCAFCAQSSHNPGASAQYGLLEDAELMQRINALLALPVAHIGLVASGPFLSGGEFERLCNFLDSLPAKIKDKICLSTGRLPAQCLADLRTCGIRRYHHNLETSRNYYPRICSTQTWQARCDTVLRAAEAGFETCCGGLFGMGESWQDRLDLANTLASLEIGQIPINFLNPRANTRLAARSAPAPTEGLRIVALFRRVLPEATLRICGGRKECLGSRQGDVFRAGANALMSGDFLTTKGSGLDFDLRLIHNNGLEVLDNRNERERNG